MSDNDRSVSRWAMVAMMYFIMLAQMASCVAQQRSADAASSISIKGCHP